MLEMDGNGADHHGNKKYMISCGACGHIYSENQAHVCAPDTKIGDPQKPVRFRNRGSNPYPFDMNKEQWTHHLAGKVMERMVSNAPWASNFSGDDCYAIALEMINAGEKIK